MGTVDESHHDVMNACSHLHGNLLEPLHNLRPARWPFGVERPVLRAADRLPEHNLAVDHDHQRALILQSRGVYADPEVVDGDAIVAVRGEVVIEPDATPG